jgi:phage recombination protein Bet
MTTTGDGAPTRRESAVRQFSEKEVALLKRTICQGATDEELSMFIQNCKRYGLDPFTGQIHAVKRWDSNAGREVLNVQVGIDGFRLIADRTGKWNGTIGPYWCGQDGEWTEPWLSDGYPAAAKVGVLRSDFSEPRWGIARWGAYVATKKGGDPNYMWRKMPAHMLAKCAEALALRSAFPNDLSGLYTDAEMDQAGGSEKRTYDGPDPQEVDAEVVEKGSSKTVGNTHGSEEAAKQDQPDYEARIRQIHKWLGTKPPEKLESALGEVQQKISDWPDSQKTQARAVTLPYAALDQLHKRGPGAEDQLSEWVREKGSELPDEWVQRALTALEEEAEAMRPDQSEQAAEAIMDGETALNSDTKDGAEESPKDEGTGRRRFSDHEEAIQELCPTALRQGKLNHIPEEERISSEKESPDDTTQLGRLFRIAYQEEDWEESWVDRLIKDELGYESKKHIPKGKAYDEIIEALRSDGMRFWMSRDPDTADLFDDPAEDEEVPV